MVQSLYHSRSPMQRLKFISAVFTCSFGLIVFVGVVFAGSLSPLASPAATSYTLEDIYTRLTTNATATAGNHSFAPSGAPAGSLYTLTQLYDAIPTIVANTVKLGTSYLGITGTLTPDGGTATTAAVFTGSTVHTTGDWTLDTGTLTLACAVSAFDGMGNKVADAYDGAGNGTNRWCMTESGDASAGDLLSGKTVWVDGQAVSGSMTDREGDNASTAQAAVGGVNYLTGPAGYYDGDDRVSATDAEIAALDSDIAVGNIVSGISIFGIAGGAESGYPSSGWIANGSGDGSTPLTEANCTSAANWYWFEDGNGDGDTTDPEDGICIKETTVTSVSWNGDDYSSERDNTYIAAYTCTGNFPSGTVDTYSGINSTGTEDATWNDGDCALCQADCYDGKKDLPDQGGYTTPNEDIAGHHGPITPEVLEQWKGTRLPTSNDFFGFCGYSDGGSDYETSCSSDTTHGNYGQMVGRTDECIDLSNSGAWEWLSEQHGYTHARVAGDDACSYFGSYAVNADYRFRAVFRP